MRLSRSQGNATRPKGYPMKYSRILILHENVRYEETQQKGIYLKTSRDIYLDIGTEDKHNEIALDILTARFGKPNKDFGIIDPSEPEPCPITQAEWEALADGDEGYEAAAKQVRDAITARRDYENALKENRAILQCIASKDARLAPALLEARLMYRNEGYSVAYVIDRYSKD